MRKLTMITIRSFCWCSLLIGCYSIAVYNVVLGVSFMLLELRVLGDIPQGTVEKRTISNVFFCSIIFFHITALSGGALALAIRRPDTKSAVFSIWIIIAVIRLLMELGFLAFHITVAWLITLIREESDHHQLQLERHAMMTNFNGTTTAGSTEISVEYQHDYALMPDHPSRIWVTLIIGTIITDILFTPYTLVAVDSYRRRICARQLADLPEEQSGQNGKIDLQEKLVA